MEQDGHRHTDDDGLRNPRICGPRPILAADRNLAPRAESRVSRGTTAVTDCADILAAAQIQLSTIRRAGQDGSIRHWVRFCHDLDLAGDGGRMGVRFDAGATGDLRLCGRILPTAMLLVAAWTKGLATCLAAGR